MMVASRSGHIQDKAPFVLPPVHQSFDMYPASTGSLTLMCQNQTTTTRHPYEDSSLIKIAVNRLSSSSFSLEDISAPPISFSDADSDVSYSFLSNKNMFEWSQITMPHQRRVRVRLCYSKERQMAVIEYTMIPLFPLSLLRPLHDYRTWVHPKTSHLGVSNESPSATEMCIYSCTSADGGSVNVNFVISLVQGFQCRNIVKGGIET